MLKIGYSVQVSKTTHELEGVSILLATPIGIAEVPVEEYILMCDPIEALEVMFESAEYVMQTQEEVDFEIKIPVSV